MTKVNHYNIINQINRHILGLRLKLAHKVIMAVSVPNKRGSP